jgi:hypothetical protein
MPKADIVTIQASIILIVTSVLFVWRFLPTGTTPHLLVFDTAVFRPWKPDYLVHSLFRWLRDAHGRVNSTLPLQRSPRSSAITLSHLTSALTHSSRL